MEVVRKPKLGAPTAGDSRHNRGLAGDHQRVLAAVWTSLIVLFIAVALITQWRKITEYDWQLSFPYLILALLPALLRRLCCGVNFIYLLSRVSRRPLAPGFLKIFETYFVADLARYLPGTLWYIPWRLKVFREYGISRSHTLVASGVEALLMAIAYGLAGLPLLLQVLTSKQVVDLRWFLGALLLGVLVVQPPVMRFLFRLLSRVLRRPMEEPHLELRQILVAFGSLVIQVVLTGVSVYYLVKCLHPALAADTFLFFTGAFALAWTIGFITLFAPAGLGVREGLLVWLFSLQVPLPVAAVVALATRVISIVEDVTWAAIAILVGRLRKQDPPAA